MKKPKGLIAKEIPVFGEEYIEKYCNYEKIQEGSYEKLLNKVEDKEGLLLTGIPIDENLLNHAPNLKAVSNISVGYNNFDLKVMKERGVIGTHIPEVLDDTVADLIFTLIFASARRVTELDTYVKDGKWDGLEEISLFGKDVHHATLGIIGMGRIGEAVAKRARLGFDMEVLYYNRTRKHEVEENLGGQYTDFKTLLPNIVTLPHIGSATEKTRGDMAWISSRRFVLFIIKVNPFS